MACDHDREEHTQRTLAALKRFTEQLESGEPIPVTIVRQESTPDGPLTTFEKSTLDEFLEELT